MEIDQIIEEMISLLALSNKKLKQVNVGAVALSLFNKRHFDKERIMLAGAENVNNWVNVKGNIITINSGIKVIPTDKESEITFIFE